MTTEQAGHRSSRGDVAARGATSQLQGRRRSSRGDVAAPGATVAVGQRVLSLESCVLSWGAVALEGPHQAIQHPAELVVVRSQRGCLVFRGVAKPLRQVNVVAHLGKRRVCDVEELQELALGLPRRAFDNIHRHRHNSATHLAGEIVRLVLRKGWGFRVHLDDEVVRGMKHLPLPESLGMALTKVLASGLKTQYSFGHGRGR